PALLTIRCGTPCAATTASRKAERAAASARSTRKSCIPSVGGIALRAARITVAPAPLSRAAVAAPMPRDAPVTRAMRPASGALTSPSLVLDVVARRLPEPDAHQPPRGHPRGDLLPDEDGDVLRRRQPLGEPRHVEVQVAMVEHRMHVRIEERLEVPHIDDIPRLGIDLALDLQLDLVVVAVVVRVVARAESLAIPRVGARRVVEPVRGVEVGPTDDEGARHGESRTGGGGRNDERRRLPI